MRKGNGRGQSGNLVDYRLGNRFVDFGLFQLCNGRFGGGEFGKVGHHAFLGRGKGIVCRTGGFYRRFVGEFNGRRQSGNLINHSLSGF